MRVGGHDELDPPRARLADPARLHVEAVRVAVDLHRRARLRHRVEDLLHAAGEGRPAQDVAAQGVAPDLELRAPHGRHQAVRHLVGVHAEAVVDAGDDHVELREHGVGIVEGPVGQDVRFRTPEQPHAHLLLRPRDVVPLAPEAVQLQAARVVRGGRVVGDGEVLHPHGVRALRHLLHRVLAVRVVRVAVDHPLHVRQLEERRGQLAPQGGLDLARILAQLGRDEGQPEVAVHVRFVLEGDPAARAHDPARVEGEAPGPRQLGQLG